jgi:hypothetical protein
MQSFEMLNQPPISEIIPQSVKSKNPPKINGIDFVYLATWSC